MWCITIMHCYALLCTYLFIYETDVQNSILNNFYTFIIIFGTRQLTALLLQSWVFRDQQMLIEKSHSQSHIKPLFLMAVWEGCNRLELQTTIQRMVVSVGWVQFIAMVGNGGWNHQTSIHLYKTGWPFEFQGGKKPLIKFPSVEAPISEVARGHRSMPCCGSFRALRRGHVWLRPGGWVTLMSVGMYSKPSNPKPQSDFFCTLHI